MKRVILYAVTTGMIWCNYACNKEESTKEVKPAEPIYLTLKQFEKVDADNRFSFNMFKQVSSLNGNNTFFSPLSLNMALGMLYNGTSGETRTEMAEVLGMAGFTDAEINEYYQKMSKALQNIDPLTDIGIANSIWYRAGFSVKQPFIDVNQSYFDAVVRSLDFANPNAADIINQWCADKTKNKIEEIVDNPIPEDVMMYLINALYFKSNWKFQFDKTKTQQLAFTKTNNQQKTVNMMMQESVTLPFYADQYLTCVEMPYGNQAFSMVAILPASNSNIEQLIEHLDYTTWENILNNLHEKGIKLGFPRFKIECEMTLNEPLQNVGMKRIFLGGLANIADADLAVSKVKQKTFVEVNEEGTEAAAVTVIEMKNTSSTSPSFYANRPFLYLIKEKSTGAILFIGRMDEPGE